MNAEHILIQKVKEDDAAEVIRILANARVKIVQAIGGTILGLGLIAAVFLKKHDGIQYPLLPILQVICTAVIVGIGARFVRMKSGDTPGDTRTVDSLHKTEPVKSSNPKRDNDVCPEMTSGLVEMASQNDLPSIFLPKGY